MTPWWDEPQMEPVDPERGEKPKPTMVRCYVCDRQIEKHLAHRAIVTDFDPIEEPMSGRATTHYRPTRRVVDVCFDHRVRDANGASHG